MNIIWLDTIDSTNTEALRRLAELPSMTVLAAREQTAGRGQRGNTWFTEPGKNLTFSIVVKFAEGQLHASQVHWLNYLMSDVVSMFLRSYGIDCTIKWPNDVYVQRRKICGILIENTLKGEWVDAAVIGTGININQREFPQLANATSLVRCYGQEQDLEACMEKVAALFEEELPWLFSERSRAALEGAELVIAVVDGSRDYTEEDREILRAAERAGHGLVVLSKQDLSAAVEHVDTSLPVIPLSSVTGEGLDRLEAAIAALFPLPQTPAGEILTNARQAEAVGRAAESLRAALEALDQGLTPDLVLTESETAMSALGELTGRSVRQDVTDRIFQRFCVGK